MAHAKETEKDSSSQDPVYSLRYRGVAMAVFANETKVEGRTITFHKVSLHRYYKEGDEWKVSNGYSRDDLPIVRLLMLKAYEWVLAAEAKRKETDD